MLRFLFFRLLPLLLLFWLLRGILRAIFASVNAASASRTVNQGPKVPTGGDLKRDPVCGTFVAEGTSVTKRVNGELLHFCSTACRDKYRVAS